MSRAVSVVHIICSHASHSTQAAHADPTTLRLLIALAEQAPKIFATTALPSLPNLLAQQPPQRSVALRVQLLVTAALNAPPDMLPSLGTGSLLPLLQQQTTAPPDDDDDSMMMILESLVQAADQVPDLLLPIAAAVASYLVSTTTDLSAMHVVCRMAQLGKDATVVTAVQTQLVPAVLQVLAEAVDQNDNDDDWAAQPPSLQPDSVNDDGDIEYAQELLQDMLRVGGLTVLLSTVQAWMSNNNSHQHVTAVVAAMMALQCAVAAVPRSMAPYWTETTQAGLQCCADEKAVAPRVQHEGLVLLGLLCTTAATTTPDPKILEVTTRATQSPCAKVAATACQVLVSYCRSHNIIISPYDLSIVVPALLAGPLASPEVVVRMRGTDAVACLAQSSGPDFAPYYASVMPRLLMTTSNQQPAAAQEMGSALQAASMLGQAVGEELFASDAVVLLQQYIHPLLQQADRDTELDQYLLSACARIASVLKEAYAPYADAVLPHLLKLATAPTDVEFSEGDERGLEAGQEYDDEGESMTIAVPGRGLTKVTINTTKMQEKSLALRAIYEHAVALGPSFGPFAKACLDAFVPLVAFRYSSEIRATAAQALAAVFEAACAFGEEETMEIPRAFLPLAAKAIATQSLEEDAVDMENVFALADSLSDILRSVYVRLGSHGHVLLNNLNLDDAKLIVQKCMESMVACLKRRSLITQRMVNASSEDELDDCQRELDHEGELLMPLVDSVGYTLKFFKQAFVPIFETEVAPVLGQYLRAGHDIPARVSAVCLFDDCVEHCGGEAAAKFAPQLVEGAVRGMDPASNGGNEDLTRASIYGIAQIARFAQSSVLASYAPPIVNRLVSYATAETQEDSNPAIQENAVSALASLVLFEKSPFRGSSLIKRETALRIFLSSLPLREDEDEAKICHAGLCELIEHSWIQPSSEHEHLVRIIGETLALVQDGEDLADHETCMRFTKILMHMQQQLPHDQIHRSFNALPSEAQAAINLAFEQNASAFANVVSP